MGFGLLGKTLAHSYSPLIHAQFGIEDYKLFEVPPEEVEGFVRGCGLEGLNVTVPYKHTVLPLCDTLSDTAKRLGNVNTLLFRNGRIHGDNTDFAGLRAALLRGGFEVKGKKVVILGTGGSAKTAQAVARELCAREVVCISRTGEENYETLPRHSGAHLLINATPVGMYPDCAASPVSLDVFKGLEGVFDLVFNPLRTRLLQRAKARGIPCAGGLFMLAEQGRAAAELFLGSKIPFEESGRAHAALLRHGEGIALVGMPGSGKTTVARALAALLKRPWADLDALIEEKTSRSPASIIEQDGEEAFRDIESAELAAAARAGGGVLSTGGGAALREENRLALGQNSRVYWLRRPLGELSTENRPLSQNLPELYARRAPAYKAAADAEIEVRATPEETARAIAEEFYEYTRAQRP